MDKQNNYKSYIKSLHSFSECFKPIIKAHTARYLEQDLPPLETVNLEIYCVYERRQVEKFRKLVKEERNHIIA